MEGQKKIITLKVEESIHKQLKRLCVDKETTLQEYITTLIKKDLKGKE